MHLIFRVINVTQHPGCPDRRSRLVSVQRHNKLVFGSGTTGSRTPARRPASGLSVNSLSQNLPTGTMSPPQTPPVHAPFPLPSPAGVI